MHTHSSASIWPESGPYYFPPEAAKEDKPTTPFAKIRQTTMEEPFSPDLQIHEMPPSETGDYQKMKDLSVGQLLTGPAKAEGAETTRLLFSRRLPLSILPQDAS